MDSTFLILNNKEGTTKAGKRYFNLRLKFSGNHPEHPFKIITAMVWGPTIELKEGNVISSNYKEEEFKGVKQLILEKYKVLAESIEKNSELEKEYKDIPKFDVEKIYNDLYLQDWQDDSFNDFFSNLDNYLKTTSYNGITLYEKLKLIPAGTRHHHSFCGGLLKHIEEMYQIAESLCQSGFAGFGNIIDENVLQAAILVHDLGKIFEYSETSMLYSRSAEGSLFGHPAQGMLLVERLFPNDDETKVTKAKIMHCVLSHHGKEISEIAPAIPEAIALHYIDGLSAALDYANRAYNNDGLPTECVDLSKSIERYDF